jgi:uncharacterized protein
MKAKANIPASMAVIDPGCPWRLPWPHLKIPKFPVAMSGEEWRALLAKASQGDTEAELRVAEAYSDGCKDGRGKTLVRISPRKAVGWYRRSAQHGSPIAQGALGYLLSEGIGAERDAREAILWMKRAFVSLGSLSDANNIAITYRQSGDLRQAVRWLRTAIAAGDEDDLVQLGVHLYWGKGIRRDHAAAVRYFRRATNAKRIGEDERNTAFFYLGIAYLEGLGARKSLTMARKCFERANKDDDHPAAQRLLRKTAKMQGARP